MNAIARVSEPPAGLSWGAEATPVPLQGVKVHAEILGHGSRVTMAQRFRNTETVPIEAVYVFPVPEAAGLCGMAMRVGDRRIEGEVTERDKAFEAYDDAMAAGHGAALLDAERPNVFTMSVGNILPGQECVIELKWVAELRMEGEAIRFMLPTTVAPRYAPREDQLGVSPTPAERVNPPVGLDVPYGVELDVEIGLACPVRAVDSPSHPVRVEMDGARARVTLSHGVTAMDRDFVLFVTPESRTPAVLLERNDDGLATAAVSFVPQLAASTARNEVVFLVDRSGSMGGSSIEQVRAALHLCLRSLRAGDAFNIVGFGSHFNALFPRSVPYEQAALERATSHVDALDADMGGTEILPALQSVLEREPADGLPRQVVLLTDGEVTNEAAVIELAEQHSARTRIFTFGIGYGASEHLVRALARVTMGEAEFIQPGERIEPKVLRQFARLGRPAVRDVKVTWDGGEVTLQAPFRPSAIFDREAGVIYARFKPAGNAVATLAATAEGKPLAWTLPVDASRAEAGDLLATLAARAAIRDLEEGTSALHEGRRGSARADRRDDRVRKAIVALATTYRLASRETSFVAIDRREAADDQPAAELRRVPVALTHGWGGISRVSAGSAMYLVRCAAPAPTIDGSPAAPPPMASLASWAKTRIADAPTEIASSGLYTGDKNRSLPSPDRPHVAVARLQRADGSWPLDRALCRALGASLSELRSAAKTMDRSAEAQALVATLAALRFLETHASDVRDEWCLLAVKAEQWLAAALASRPAGTRERLEALLRLSSAD